MIHGSGSASPAGRASPAASARRSAATTPSSATRSTWPHASKGPTRLYRTSNLVCGRTAEAIRASFELREIDTVFLPGIDAPQAIFEIVGRAGQVSAEQQELRARYELALSAYRGGDWPSARHHFADCLSISPEDGPTRTMLTADRVARRDAGNGRQLEQRLAAREGRLGLASSRCRPRVAAGRDPEPKLGYPVAQAQSIRIGSFDDPNSGSSWQAIRGRDLKRLLVARSSRWRSCGPARRSVIACSGGAASAPARCRGPSHRAPISDRTVWILVPPATPKFADVLSRYAGSCTAS